MRPRPIVRLVTAHTQREGGGFVVRRPLPTRGLDGLDPLLMLDELGPVVYGPGEAVGAPDHPHRGFETVTYLLDGELEHADSAGHAGTLGPGDVQWMTAGAGVVHREMPSARVQREGGRVHGFQLWVNLPARLKGATPRYQELRAADVPIAVSDDGLAEVAVIAGEALGVRAPTLTHTPLLLLHVRLEAGARLDLPLPADHRVAVYAFDGIVLVSDKAMAPGQLAVLGDGDALSVRAAGPAQVLVLGGVPLGEPVAWSGPFVMNTREELEVAWQDYQAGRLGRIPPEIVRA